MFGVLEIICPLVRASGVVSWDLCVDAGRGRAQSQNEEDERLERIHVVVVLMAGYCVLTQNRCGSTYLKVVFIARGNLRN